MSFESSHKRLRAAAPRYRKGIASVVAFLGVVAASGLLSGDAQAWVVTIIAGLGAAGVIRLKNKEK